MPSPSRRDQRIVLFGLVGLANAAVIRPLLVPRQPPLPRLRQGVAIPDGWSLDAAQPAAPARRSHPAWRSVAVGPTYRLLNESDQVLLLTPMASWSREAIVEACVSGNGNSRTPQDTGDGEIAAPTHACLTRHRKVASEKEEIAALLRQRDPRFFTQPLLNLVALLLPVRPRYSTAVLLTAGGEVIEREAAWQDPSFVEGLSEAVLWSAESNQ